MLVLGNLVLRTPDADDLDLVRRDMTNNGLLAQRLDSEDPFAKTYVGVGFRIYLVLLVLVWWLINLDF